MRGHTSDNVLAACLASLILRVRQKQAACPADSPLLQYFDGQLDAAREVAVLLYVDQRVDEILAREATGNG